MQVLSLPKIINKNDILHISSFIIYIWKLWLKRMIFSFVIVKNLSFVFLTTDATRSFLPLINLMLGNQAQHSTYPVSEKIRIIFRQLFHIKIDKLYHNFGIFYPRIAHNKGFIKTLSINHAAHFYALFMILIFTHDGNFRKINPSQILLYNYIFKKALFLTFR